MIGKKRIFFAILLLLPFLSLFSAWGWAQGGGGGGSGGGGSTGGGSTGGSSTGGQQSSGTQTDRQRPMFLSGRVLLDDGQVPGTRTKIELTCQGSVVRQEYTSHSGSFSIEIAGGSQQGTLPMDASVPSSGSSSQQFGGMGASPFGSLGLAGGGGLASTRSIDLSNCELQARLPGYQSDVIALGRRRALDNPDVGLIILHNMKPPEGGTVSLKTLAAPKDAMKAYEKAGKELQKEKPNYSKVSKELAKAVEIYPEFASAWHMLGRVRLEQNDRPAAIEAFEQAKAADSEYVNPILSLALINLEEARWEKAAALCRQALELNPRLTRSHYLNALANSSLGRINIAEESALLVLDSNQVQTYPLIYYVLGFAESQRGNFPSAAARYRSFLEIQPDVSLAGKLRDQLAQWQERGLIQ